MWMAGEGPSLPGPFHASGGGEKMPVPHQHVILGPWDLTGDVGEGKGRAEEESTS